MKTRLMARRVGTQALSIGALALVLAVVPFAACLAAAGSLSTTQPPPCCAGLHSACDDAMTTQADCCAVPQADLARVASGSDVVHASLPDGVAATGVEPFVPAVRVIAFDRHAATPSSPPIYLLVSLLRI